jgi:hypothetical protein
MTIQVSIQKGYYRGNLVSGVFQLIKPFSEGAKGGCITIKNPTPDPGTPPVQRIQVEKGDFKLLDAAGEELGEHITIETAVAGSVGGAGVVVGTNYEQAFVSSETEPEAMERLNDTFLMLDEIVDSCSKNEIRGLVVSGPPGIGKSFGVEKQLESANMFRTIKGLDPLYEFVSGGVSAIGLYQKLYYNRNKNQVVIFDDSDQILFDEESLSLLKAALNSGDKRRICWNKESRVLAVEDIPEAFDFDASIIFLSNIDFDRTISKGSRISDHLSAILSRCHYLDLEIGSLRDRLLVIKLRVNQGMLNPYSFTVQQEQDILDFVFSNAEYLREVSLRMVKKIADFVKTDPVGWARKAEATTLQRESKFKRLLERRQQEAAKKGLVLAEQ